MVKATCISSGNCHLVEVGQAYLIRPLGGQGKHVYVNYLNTRHEKAFFAILNAGCFEVDQEESAPLGETITGMEQLSLF